MKVSYPSGLLRAFLVAVLTISGVQAGPETFAGSLTVDPDTGTLSVGGAYASSVLWNGVTIKAGGVGTDGAREYLVYGDFNVGVADTVTAKLDTAAGVRFIVGNNANLGGTFNFSASGSQTRAGGGLGGLGGSGSPVSPGGSGGAGGTGGAYGTDGHGGAGGMWLISFGASGQSGQAGGAGSAGAAGTQAALGLQGTWAGAGQNGFNNGGSGGGSVAGGTGGAGGAASSVVANGAASVTASANGGAGGAIVGAGGYGGRGGLAGSGATVIGASGGTGGVGNNGLAGLPGSNNPASPFALTGGGGGAGGSQGGSGGGGGGGQGGGGGSGGQGGGGGGGGAAGPLGPDGTNGSGGTDGGVGGRGGTGGAGGSGGIGGTGGMGGTGGGAVEIRVLGRLEGAGVFRAAGSNGAGGSGGGSPTGNTGGLGGANGGNGEDHGYYDHDDHWHVTLAGGNPGHPNGNDGPNGFTLPWPDLSGVGGGGGTGGMGGAGSAGGAGAAGGPGAWGGPGAGGAGGTVKIVASVISGNASIDTRGGDGGATVNPANGQIISSGTSGLNGRFVLGRNTTDAWTGSLTGSTKVDVTDGVGKNLGTRKMNPYVYGWSTQTPYIPDLADGADIMGVTGLSAKNQDFAGVLAGAPTGSLAALVRMDKGAGSMAQNWAGFDMLYFANLSDKPLELPYLGVGAKGYAMSLMTGGWARDPLFGGNGQYGWLSALEPGQVYATLIPDGTTNFNMMAGGGNFTWQENLTVGDAMYMSAVPEPSTLAQLGIGASLIAFGCWRRWRKRPMDCQKRSGRGEGVGGPPDAVNLG